MNGIQSNGIPAAAESASARLTAASAFAAGPRPAAPRRAAIRTSPPRQRTGLAWLVAATVALAMLAAERGEFARVVDLLEAAVEGEPFDPGAGEAA